MVMRITFSVFIHKPIYEKTNLTAIPFYFNMYTITDQL